MFDIFKSKDKELYSYLDIVRAGSSKLQLHKFAIEKSIDMIAKAVAKSEIKFLNMTKDESSEIYYRLNVRPNHNETGTDFWYEVVKKLLTENECLICRASSNFYRVEGYTCNDKVMSDKTYTGVTITDGRDSTALDMPISASDMIVLNSKNNKVKKYLENVIGIYDKTLNALHMATKIANTPKYKLKIEGSLTIKEAPEREGEAPKILTSAQYKDRVAKTLDSEDLSVLLLGSGIDLESLKTETGVSNTEDIVKMAKEIFTMAAMAFDIPLLVYQGNITEKSDASNEFITYAVSPIVEIINDALNAKLVGEKDYLAGERIKIDTTHFKYIDVLDASAGMDKLRSLGFNFDEIREIVGYDALNTDFSTERVITKNYTNELGGNTPPKNNEGGGEE